MNDAELQKIEKAKHELDRGDLRFCTRCGSEVGPYQSNQSYRGWGIYDKPVDTDDGLTQTGDAAYWCPKCEATWKAVGRLNTGRVEPCGHFMPLGADYCAACGQRTGGAAEPTAALGPDGLRWWEDLREPLLERYRVERLLGQGGMAEVLLAHDERPDKLVAIKAPNLDAFAPNDLAELLQRFQREVRRQAEKPIVGIVTLHDAGEVMDRHGARHPFLVMDYLSGGSLGDALGGTPGNRTHRQTLNEVLAWLRPIASTLDHLHGQESLHRDIKPENILFDADRHPFLADFSIATARDDIAGNPQLSWSVLGAGRPGSPGYQPPESLRGEMDASSDQFSLAVTVYEALSGCLPFKSFATPNSKPTALSVPCPEMPEEAVATVMRAMALNSGERHISCSEFAAALADAAAHTAPVTQIATLVPNESTTNQLSGAVTDPDRRVSGMRWWEDLSEPLLGRYRVERLLGQGGMAEVLLARDERLDKLVAIKAPNLDAFAPNQLSELLQRFQREVRRQAKEPIVGVVAMHDAGEVTDRQGARHSFLVMDYLSGGSLGDALGGCFGNRTHRQTLNEVLAWLRPIATALDHVHGRKSLHRDIKPDNILFNADRYPFLADFGIATSLDEVAGTTLSGSMSGSRMAPGSPGYQAPESLTGEKLASSDQFSLAVTVYEALSGALPMAATTWEGWFKAMVHWNPIPLSERCPELPTAAVDAVARAMAADPKARYLSCSEFAAALADAAAHTAPVPAPLVGPPVPAAIPDPTVAADPGRARERGWRWLAWTVAAISLIGAGIYGRYLWVQAEEDQVEADQAAANDAADQIADKIAADAVAAHKVAVDKAVELPTPGQPGGSVPAAGTVFQDCPDVCPEMVVIPEGRFTMGSSDSEGGRAHDEGPQHTVVIGYPFAIGKYDVTFAQWDACVAAGGCNGYKPGDEGWGRGNQPVINVNWDDAQAYVKWLSQKTGKHYRLLSESEWEYAARAGTTTVYYWGDDAGSNHADCKGCGSKWDDMQTAPVGSFAPNAFGLYDMAGNVLQWVEDCYTDSYTGAPANGSSVESSESSNCGLRMQRGGSYALDPNAERSAFRFANAQPYGSILFGLRVAQDL